MKYSIVGLICLWPILVGAFAYEMGKTDGRAGYTVRRDPAVLWFMLVWALQILLIVSEEFL